MTITSPNIALNCDIDVLLNICTLNIHDKYHDQKKKDQKNRELGDRESNPDIRRDRTEY